MGLGRRFRGFATVAVFVAAAGCGGGDGGDDERDRVSDQFARQSRATMTGAGIEPTTDRCRRAWGIVPDMTRLSEARFLKTCVNG